MTRALGFVLGFAMLWGANGCGDDSSTGGNGSGASGQGGDTGSGATSGEGGFVAVPPGSETFGDVHEGSYHLGPVDFAETAFHNSCAPYPTEVQNLTGPFLAGIDQSLNGDGNLCDACALVTTRLGKQVLVHVVTTGVSNAPGDMDMSPDAYDLIHEDDPQGTPENPRPMNWQLARCPENGNILLQFQTGANPYWTSLWVRNARMPFDHVAVRSTNHADWFSLRRETDGTLNDDGGFGEGAFDLQFVSVDGQTIEVTLQGFEPGSLVDTGVQFQ
ncbi:MAG: hypothetical protein U0271_37625 [Polyangiaceae bacterium]